MTTANPFRGPTFFGLILAGSYVILSSLYIIVSTMAIGNALDGESEMVQAEMIKGLLFIFITGVLLFFGARYLLGHIVRQSQEIEKQRQSIIALDKRASSGLLASAIGHDANNLLTSVRLSVDLLKMKIPPERQEVIIENLSKVIDELMILNKRLVQGGQADQPGELKEHCIKQESERVLHFLDPSHPAASLQLEIVGVGDVSTMLNRHLYFQVMLNLLSNIARHAGKEATARVLIEEADDCIRVSVEDNGQGVPETIRENIFEPYFSQHPEGSGLGLASVRAIMRMHKGDATCERSELGGAKFVLTFPKSRSPMPVAS